MAASMAAATAASPASSSASLSLNQFMDDSADIQVGDRVLLIVENEVNFARFLYEMAHENGFSALPQNADHSETMNRCWGRLQEALGSNM